MSSSWSIKRKYWWKFVSPYIHLHVYVWNPFSFDVIIAFLISILFSTNFFIYARMKVVSCWLINVIPECHFEIELICGGWAGEQLEWGIRGYLLTCRRMEWNGSSWLCCILNFIRRRNVWWRKVMMRILYNSIWALNNFFSFYSFHFSVRSVMHKYLEKENEVNFDKIFNQVLGKSCYLCMPVISSLTRSQLTRCRCYTYIHIMYFKSNKIRGFRECGVFQESKYRVKRGITLPYLIRTLFKISQ